MSILSSQKQSVSADFPNVRPSLDLRFALAKKLDPRITFTRGSSGTYFGPDGLMRTAGVNEPRFDHDSVTGQSLGLLVEESRTNFYVTSDTLTNGRVGSSSGATYTDFNEGGPFNRQFTRVTRTGVRNTDWEWSINYSNTGLSIGQTFVVSFYARSHNKSRNNIRFSNPDAESQAFTITSEWKRFFATFTYGAQGGLAFFRINRGNGGASTMGTSYDIAMIQIEVGSFPTSYIPTSGSQVTRSADTPNITNTTSFFNSTEGTLVVDSEMPYQTLSKFPAIGFARSGGSSNNTIQFLYYNTNIPYIQYLVRDAANGGRDLIASSSPNQTVGSYKKFIATYKVGEYNFYFDGKFVGRSTTNKALPTNLTYMEIGTNGNSDNRLNGHIRRITYYPIQLTNQQLINLTS